MIKRINHIIFICLCAVVMWACGGPTTFKIVGEVEGGRTMNLRLVFNGDDVINNVLTAARDGKFEFEGRAPEGGTMVEILDNDFRPMARMFVRNGDKINVKIDPSSPYGYTATGNDETERLSEFISANRKTLSLRVPKTTNALIANYIKGHKDDLVSSMLLVTEYFVSADPVAAQKLLEGIAREARPDILTSQWIAANRHGSRETIRDKVLPLRYLAPGDTVLTWRPTDAKVNLLSFSNEQSGRRDSVLNALRDVDKKRAKGKFAILDMSLEPDTFSWSHNVRRDSIKWATGWAPGAVSAPGIERLGIPSLPFFIVTDATGRQIYRGPSVKRMQAVVDSMTIGL